ncbi:MAG: hypothetical protein HS116_18420 [Planctomycetes bacterium]|nr:hypothetical protein [Planctomycetota bacterium]
MPTNDERARMLLARRSDLETLREQWTVVRDVLKGPAGLKNATYLPQHQAEHEEEYKKRKALTPVFTETPSVLQSRLGALAKQPAEFELPDTLKEFENKATLKGLDLRDLVLWAASRGQIEGFLGILLDREPLPPEAQTQPISEAEASSRKLGRVFAAPYAAEQILSWGSDAHGLAYVRLIESGMEQASWDAKPEKVHRVRLVGRKFIQLMTVRERDDAGEKYTIEEGPQIAHGATDAEGKEVVPFVFMHPFAADDDGIGRSILQPGAEADTAALWLLSEALWLCYMMAPILTYKTNKPDDEIQKIALGASRFVPLDNGTTGVTPPESLEFVALDATAVERISAMWEKMVAKAKEFGGKQAAAAMPLATEQSGISKAWSFKTTEERVLFMLARCLDQGFTELLQLAARMSGADPDKVSVTFPDQFDVADAAESFEAHARAVEFLQGFGLNSAVVALLRKAIETVLPSLDTEMRKRLDQELDALLEAELRPGAILDRAPKEDDEGDGGDSGLKADKVPLSLQQLALARERAKKLGDEASAKAIGVKMAELLKTI